MKTRLGIGYRTALAVTAALLLLGGMAAYATFSMTGTSSATATTTDAPTVLTEALFVGAPTIFGTPPYALAAPDVEGACTGDPSTFSCSGTVVAVGQSYTVAVVVSDPAPGAESATLTYSDSGAGWSTSCAVDGVSVASGGAAALGPGDNALVCVVSATEATADALTVALSG